MTHRWTSVSGTYGVVGKEGPWGPPFRRGAGRRESRKGRVRIEVLRPPFLRGSYPQVRHKLSITNSRREPLLFWFSRDGNVSYLRSLPVRLTFMVSFILTSHRTVSYWHYFVTLCPTPRSLTMVPSGPLCIVSLVLCTFTSNKRIRHLPTFSSYKREIVKENQRNRDRSNVPDVYGPLKSWETINSLLLFRTTFDLVWSWSLRKSSSCIVILWFRGGYLHGGKRLVHTILLCTNTEHGRLDFNKEREWTLTGRGL